MTCPHGWRTAFGRTRPCGSVYTGSRHHIREEKPIALDEQSEPEPDVVVVPSRLRDYLTAHPSRPVLVVEVADTTSLALVTPLP